MEIEWVEKYGLWGRGGTNDIDVMQEVFRSYSLFSYKGKCVLDIGGHIGGFAVMALRDGAKFVASYEPCKESYDILLLNTRKWWLTEQIKNINAAVMHADVGGTVLYKSMTGKNPGSNSVIPFRGRATECVPTVAFSDVLDSVQPDVIKMDCEGAEYSLLLQNALPLSVHEIVLEIHLNKRLFRERVYSLISVFDTWEVVHTPKFNEKSWFCLGAWRR